MSALRSPIRSALFTAIRAVIRPFLIGGGALFNPGDLFYQTDQGVWFDLDDDMDTKLQWCIDNPGYTNATFLAEFPNHALFQDSAGTTAVTAVEQPLGLVLDKSKGLVLGAELFPAGDFEGPTMPMSSDFTGATGTWALNTTNPLSGAQDGRMVITGPANSRPAIFTNTSGVAGKTYRVSFNYKVNSGAASINIAFNGSSTTNILRTLVGSGVFSMNLLCMGPTAGLGGIYFGNSACDIQIDNYSVKEIAGNHRTQATAGNRPVWTARKNQLTTTETFDDNSWILLGATRTAILGPSGAMDAVRISMAGDGDGFRSNAASFPQASIATISMWLRAPTPGLTTVQTNGGVQLPTTVVPVTTEWVKHTFTTLGGAGDSQFWFCRRTAGSTAPEVEIWNPQVEFNTVATPYQRVNTNTDYDAIGSPKGARYNGVNNGMVTSSVDFTANGVMTASYGVAHLARSGFGMICAFNTTGIGQVGTFYDTFMVGGNLEISSTTTTALHGTTSPVTLAVPIVLSTLRDNLEVSRETQIVTRVNATQQTLLFAQPNPLVAGNWVAHLLWFGENNSINRLNGIEYNTTLINKILTVEQLNNLEQFNATKSGATLP